MGEPRPSLRDRIRSGGVSLLLIVLAVICFLVGWAESAGVLSGIKPLSLELAGLTFFAASFVF